jgi:hypothetical protein
LGADWGVKSHADPQKRVRMFDIVGKMACALRR